MKKTQVLCLNTWGDFNVHQIREIFLIPENYTATMVDDIINELKEKYKYSNEIKNVVEELIKRDFIYCNKQNLDIGSKL